ncbi:MULTISPECIES: preprotein translocase subunit YajC [Clostridium]|uniref:Preprotein translocase subunit YajC n=1 Tax=Clostridium manihotivorum TaxID=2320868 RepID=A0A3R5UF15_9CLOT|nr:MULTISPECIES: preprotein translocase subunit YajC [Clostridium]QAA31917.1 preprotein translocase subunit YajC [Clostridium manihotivorum]
MPYLIQLLPMVLVLVVFYAILIIPDRKRRKQYGEMLKNLKVNDEIMTKGGIIGKIVNLQDDYIILESGPDRARIKLSRQGIGSLVNQKEDNK